MKKVFFERLNVNRQRLLSIRNRLSSFYNKEKIRSFFQVVGDRIMQIAKGISWKSPQTIAVTVLLFFLLSGLAIYLNQTTSATYVIVNGQQVGLVRNVDSGKNLVEAILKKRGQALGQVAKTHDQIEYKNVRVKTATFLEQALSEKYLDEKLNSYVDGYKLSVAGSVVAILPSKEDADKVLKMFQDYYAKPSESNKINSVEFGETVNTQQAEVQPDQVKQPEAVFKMLVAGKSTVTDYTVQANDSWWLIARKNNMKTKEVLAGNPGSTEDTVLKPGLKIKLVSVVPYLTVISQGTFTGTETIPFDVITKTDYSLDSGKTKITQQGSDGSKLVTYSYVQKNGQNVSKKVLDEKVVTPPVNQIIAKGPGRSLTTVAYATSRGSGNISGLAWPLRGRINSYYGYRWGGFHTGIDIDGDTGDPYTAAADGTVIAAGWDGGYGNMILIDHGNGVSTRYAHSSKLLVSVGQHVSKGQTIGLVGATGNATGPHLHFEIILNGDTVNPLNYLP